MKFRTRRETYTAPHTVDGKTSMIERTRSVPVPVLPRDWDTTAVRAAVVLVGLLTAVSVTWSTISIGSLLHGGIGYAAASVFDVAWGVCLLLEWLARFDKTKRRFPRNLGWALLAATMGAIFWHGMTLHLVGLAVVGAAVSLFAKVLWLGVMKHVDKELSTEDAAWVAAQISEANAKMAVAGARRAAARIEAHAAAELLAMEADNRRLMEAAGVASGTAAVAPATQDATPAVAPATADTEAHNVASAALPALPPSVSADQFAALLAALNAAAQQGATAATAADAARSAWRFSASLRTAGG